MVSLPRNHSRQYLPSTLSGTFGSDAVFPDFRFSPTIRRPRGAGGSRCRGIRRTPPADFASGGLSFLELQFFHRAYHTCWRPLRWAYPAAHSHHAPPQHGKSVTGRRPCFPPMSWLVPTSGWPSLPIRGRWLRSSTAACSAILESQRYDLFPETTINLKARSRPATSARPTRSDRHRRGSLLVGREVR